MTVRTEFDAATLAAGYVGGEDWLLEGVIPAGGLALLAGEVSCGKSWLALELGLGVAETGKAWRSDCSARGRVRYLAADGDEEELGRRVSRLCRGYGIAAPKGLVFDLGRHTFDEERSGRLEQLMLAEGCKLLIVDPVSRYLPWMSDNSTRSVGMGLRAMREVAKRTGATILLVQGFSKVRRSRQGKWGEELTDGMEQVRGSTELVAACDVVLLVRKEGRRKNLEMVKNRKGLRRWGSFFSLVDEELADGGWCSRMVFEAKRVKEAGGPATLAELVERRMKQVMREAPEKAFGRAELGREAERLVGAVGKRAMAEAFGLLGKDAEVVVATGDKNRKQYRLAEPEMAAFNRVAEEEGMLAALDLMGKKLAVTAPMRLLEKRMEEMEAKRKGGELGALLRRVMGEEGKNRNNIT